VAAPGEAGAASGTGDGTCGRAGDAITAGLCGLCTWGREDNGNMQRSYGGGLERWKEGAWSRDLLGLRSRRRVHCDTPPEREGSDRPDDVLWREAGVDRRTSCAACGMARLALFAWHKSTRLSTN